MASPVSSIEIVINRVEAFIVNGIIQFRLSNHEDVEELIIKNEFNTTEFVVDRVDVQIADCELTFEVG